jgi:phosphoglycerol transferase MdoB-like AlkP superfamily enzyme
VLKPREGQDDYYKGYKGTLAYSDKKMREIVDTLLEKSDDPPIIIIQGDHGPEKAGESKYYEILNAYYLPDNGSQSLYPTISPINSFRIVLNQYFGQHFDLLPDQMYSSKPDETTYMIPIECPVQEGP